MIRIGLVLCLMVVLLTSGCSHSREARINELKSKYPQWDQITIEKVAERQVEIGMTEEMVGAAMRKPQSVTNDRDVTTWEYTYFAPGSEGYSIQRTAFIVIFRNGRVIETRGDKSKIG